MDCESHARLIYFAYRWWPRYQVRCTTTDPHLNSKPWNRVASTESTSQTASHAWTPMVCSKPSAEPYRLKCNLMYNGRPALYFSSIPQTNFMLEKSWCQTISKLQPLEKHAQMVPLIRSTCKELGYWTRCHQNHRMIIVHIISTIKHLDSGRHIGTKHTRFLLTSAADHTSHISPVHGGWDCW